MKSVCASGSHPSFSFEHPNPNPHNPPDDIAIFDTQKIVKQLLGGNA